MRLYHQAQRDGAWDPRDIDLGADAGSWARLTEIERDVLLRLTALFHPGGAPWEGNCPEVGVVEVAHDAGAASLLIRPGSDPDLVALTEQDAPRRLAVEPRLRPGLAWRGVVKS